MYLQGSPERDILTDIFCGDGLKRAIFYEGREASEVFDEIGKLPGIEILRRFRGREPRFGCINYVFEDVMGESWLPELGSDAHTIQEQMELRGEEILKEHGYIYTEYPQDGYVVGYRFFDGLNPPRFKHWGIYREGGKVDSKFSNASSHVYRTDIGKIPACWGDVALFFTPASLKS